MKNQPKVIFHIDMNAFFASCEAIKRPYLNDLPFAVGARFTKRGVLTTANYEARKYGVKSAMSLGEALKKCPGLLIVDMDFPFYEECANRFMQIFLEYTKQVEKASVDEAYLDVSELNTNPLELAQIIQKRILEEIGLPCSIGIGPTLFLAKMASDIKKPLGITKIDVIDVQNILYPLPISSIIGIGKKTQPRLHELGIQTIGDFVDFKDVELLMNVIGKRGYQEINDRLSGKSQDYVDPTKYSEFSSIGNSRTYDHDIIIDSEIKERLLQLAKIVSTRMKKTNTVGKTISVVIKYNDFKTMNKSKTLSKYINEYLEIFDYASSIFYDFYNDMPIRLLGITMSNLKKEVIERDLFTLEPTIIKDENLKKTLDKIRNKYGESVIKRGIK